MRPWPKRVVCGVYAIAHRASGVSYVGQSIDIYGRWRGHISAASKPPPIDRKVIADVLWAIGPDQFDFVILETSLPNFLDEIELKHIDRCGSYLNGLNVVRTKLEQASIYSKFGVPAAAVKIRADAEAKAFMSLAPHMSIEQADRLRDAFRYYSPKAAIDAD